MKLVWIQDSNSNSIYDYLNALYLFCPKQRTNIVQTCMKIVQRDSLNFSDNFSYIIYFIWSYDWISMIFRSLGNFLEFSELFKIQKIIYCVSIVSCWPQQVNYGWPGQTWPVGSTGQSHSAVWVTDRWGQVNSHVRKSTLSCGVGQCWLDQSQSWHVGSARLALI